MEIDKYISLEDAIKLLRKAETGYRKTMVSQVRADMIAHCIKLICELPAADVRPVARGVWVSVHNRYGICSNCHRGDHIDPLAGFCRFCGADMRKKGEKDGV